MCVKLCVSNCVKLMCQTKEYVCQTKEYVCQTKEFK